MSKIQIEVDVADFNLLVEQLGLDSTGLTPAETVAKMGEAVRARELQKSRFLINQTMGMELEAGTHDSIDISLPYTITVANI